MDVSDKITLYDRIGGMTALSRAIDIFYLKVQEDDNVSLFFRWVNIESQSCKMKEYLAHALGGPVKYTGKSMKSAHGHLVEIGLNNEHFDLIKMHLTTSFSESGIQDELIAEVEKVVESTRRFILG